MGKNRRNRKPHRSGFTLLEVMVVLLILAAMMGIGVTAILRGQANANRRLAFTYVKVLKDAVKLYAIDMTEVPTTEQGLDALVVCPQDAFRPEKWKGPYIEVSATSKDPWGQEYLYASPGRDGSEFEIWSRGPDRIDGTDDDIGTWMPEIN